MANEQGTTALASVKLPETIAEAREAFQQNANLPGLVRFASLTGIPTTSHSFPVYQAATVGKTSELTDHTTNSDISPTDVAITVERRVVRVEPSDLGIASSTDNISARIGSIIGKARAKQVDEDILGVMTTNFSNSVGATNSTDVSMANLRSALLTLETNESDQDLILALHPKQWDHIRGDLTLTSGTVDSTDKSDQAQAVMNSGKLMGIPMLGARLLVTPRVQTGTDTNDIYLGVFGWLNEGIGYVVKDASAEVGVPVIEEERNASLGTTEFVMNYYDNAAVIRTNALVLVKSQTY